MLHVGCGLIQGREKKEGIKKKKSKEKENGIVRTDRLSNMYIEPCLPTCFFFHLYCKNFNKRLFFFFLLIKCITIKQVVFLDQFYFNCYHDLVIVITLVLFE